MAPGTTVVSRLLVATPAPPLCPLPPLCTRPVCLRSELMCITKNLLRPELQTVRNPSRLVSGIPPLPFSISMWWPKLS